MSNSSIRSDILAAIQRGEHLAEPPSAIQRRMDCWVTASVSAVLADLASENVIKRRAEPFRNTIRYRYWRD